MDRFVRSYRANVLCKFHRVDSIVVDWIVRNGKQAAMRSALQREGTRYRKPMFSRTYSVELLRGRIRADSKVAMPIVGDNLYALPTVTAN